MLAVSQPRKENNNSDNSALHQLNLRNFFAEIKFIKKSEQIDEIVVADVQAGGEDTSGVFDVNGKLLLFTKGGKFDEANKKASV